MFVWTNPTCVTTGPTVHRPRPVMSQMPCVESVPETSSSAQTRAASVPASGTRHQHVLCKPILKYAMLQYSHK